MSNSLKINVGDTVKLSSIVTIPALLQLTVGRKYEVLEVKRSAINPANDQISVRNDTGRVIGYLSRVFKKVLDTYVIPAANFNDEKKDGVVMVHSDEGKILQVILAFPDSFTEGDDDAMAGFVIVDNTGFTKPGTIFEYFDRKLFVPVTARIFLVQ